MTDIDWKKWEEIDELNQERRWKIIQNSTDEPESDDSDE